MLRTYGLNTLEREKSDMADLEVLGSISFDLKINKKEEIKRAFISLVSKLGTQGFLEEYSVLYTKILAVRMSRESSLFSADIPELNTENIPEEECILPGKETQTTVLETSILREISISTDHVNKI